MKITATISKITLHFAKVKEMAEKMALSRKILELVQHVCIQIPTIRLTLGYFHNEIT